MSFNDDFDLDKMTIVVEPKKFIIPEIERIKMAYNFIFDVYFESYLLEIFLIYINNFFKDYFSFLFWQYNFLKLYFFSLFSKRKYFNFGCVYSRFFNFKIDNFNHCYDHNNFSRIELLVLDIDFSEFNYFLFSELFPRFLILLPEFFLIWSDTISFHTLRLSLLHLRFCFYNEYLSSILSLYPKIRRLFLMRLDEFCYFSQDFWLYLYYLYYRYFVIFNYTFSLNKESFAKTYFFDPVFVFLYKSQFILFFEKFKFFFSELIGYFKPLFTFIYFFWGNFFCLKNRGFGDLLKFPLRRFYEFLYFLPFSISRYFFFWWFYILEKNHFMYLYDSIQFVNINFVNSFNVSINKYFWNVFFSQYYDFNLFFYIPFVVHNQKTLTEQFSVGFVGESTNPLKLIVLDAFWAFMPKVSFKNSKYCFNFCRRDLRSKFFYILKSPNFFLSSDLITKRRYFCISFEGIAFFDGNWKSISFDIPLEIFKFEKKSFEFIKCNKGFFYWKTPWGFVWKLSLRDDMNTVIKEVIRLLKRHKSLGNKIIYGFRSDLGFNNDIGYFTKFWFDYVLLMDWIFYEAYIEFQRVETFFMQIAFNHFFVPSKLNICKFFTLPVMGLLQISNWFIFSYIDACDFFDYNFNLGYVFYLNRILLDSFHINHIYTLFIFSRFFRPVLKLKSAKKNAHFNYVLSFVVIKDIFFKYFSGNLRFDFFFFFLFIEKRYFYQYFYNNVSLLGFYDLYYPFLRSRFFLFIPKIDTYFPLDKRNF